MTLFFNLFVIWVNPLVSGRKIHLFKTQASIFTFKIQSKWLILSVRYKKFASTIDLSKRLLWSIFMYVLACPMGMSTYLALTTRGTVNLKCSFVLAISVIVLCLMKCTFVTYFTSQLTKYALLQYYNECQSFNKVSFTWHELHRLYFETWKIRRKLKILDSGN